MKLTVFTPTYNRATTLPQLYEALQRQTDKRFEWLIIDDGSTDNTEQLIDIFRKDANAFNLRYYRQNHEGKPRAQNIAVDLAEGDLFITCDSNKYLSDNAVELILEMAETIRDIPMMCGVGGYRADFSGKIYGGNMDLGDNLYIDCTRLENEKYHILGDKASAFYTKVLQQYKSPEYPGETFISESSWLIPMAVDGYKTRWFPEILVYGEYSNDGLTKTGANSREGHSKNFLGFLHVLKLEIAAHGVEPMLYLIHEAIDIAEEKGMSQGELSTRIGCTLRQLHHIKILRAFHKFYGKISNLVKKALHLHTH